MPKTIEAVYGKGVMEPLEEIDLADGAEITVAPEDVSSPSEEERRRRFLSSAGGRKDIVDEGFLDEIYRQRSPSRRSRGCE